MSRALLTPEMGGVDLRDELGPLRFARSGRKRTIVRQCDSGSVVRKRTEALVFCANEFLGSSESRELTFFLGELAMKKTLCIAVIAAMLASCQGQAGSSKT